MGTPDPLASLDYLHLLQVRSTFDLPELPDSTLHDKPWLRAMALAEPSLLERHLQPLAAFALDNNVLKYSGPTWASELGLTAPEDIRAFIQLWKETPGPVKQWANTTLRQLGTDETTLRPHSMLERIQLGMAAYLSSHFPHFYKRWQLTLPFDWIQLLRSLEPLPSSAHDTVEAWLTPHFQALAAEVEQTHTQQIEDLELEDTELNEALFDELDWDKDPAHV